MMCDLPEEWVEISLGEVGKAVTGKTPSKNNLEHWGDALDFITPTDFKSDSKFLSQVDRRLSDEGKGAFKRLLIPSKSVIVTCIGSDMGKIAINKNDCVTNQQINSIIINQDKYDADFIHYLLKASYKVLRLYADGGSTMPIINKSTFESLTFDIPPLPEQKAIADMLSSFDDKIELLREQNKTLETLAQTIFKEWFVNFNFPDQNGKPYRTHGGAMIESLSACGSPAQAGELGLIPKGWRVGKLKEICDIKNGFAFKSKDYVGSGVPVVRTTNFKSGSVDLKAPVFLTKEKSQEFKSYFLEKFDFLLVMVGASIGKNVITPSHILPSLQNQNMWNFKPKDESLRFYNIFLLRRLVFQQANSSSGSARDFFRKDYFYGLDIAVPDRHVLMNFSSTVKPIFEKVDNNIVQIKSLSKARDMLLPKLMSGKVRVN